jgi:hypothetical protein
MESLAGTAHLLLQGLKRPALQELTTNGPPSAPQGDTLPPSLESSVVFKVTNSSNYRQRSTSSQRAAARGIIVSPKNEEMGSGSSHIKSFLERQQEFQRKKEEKVQEQRRLKALKEEQEYMEIIAQANHIQLKPLNATIGKK